MDIYLIRHGKTAGNVRKSYIGITDEPVLPEGLEALRELPPYPPADLVYITPLIRTKMTADILFPESKQVVISEFREMNFGIFEGKNYEDLCGNDQYTDWVNGNCLGTCPDGESIVEFSERVCARFIELVDQAIDECKSTLTLVVHGGVIMSLAYGLCTTKRDFYQWWVENGKCRHFQLNTTLWTKTKVMNLAEDM